MYHNENKDVSTFAAYLTFPEVQAQLRDNIVKFSVSSAHEKMGKSVANRYLSDLPAYYAYFQPLLDLLPDAIANHQLTAWVDYALYRSIVDLFSADGKLHADVYRQLNLKIEDASKGTLDILIKEYGEELVKAQLLSSYLLFLGDRVLTAIQAMTVPQLPLDDSHPITTYSIAMNQRARDIHTLTPDYIAGIKRSLDRVVANNTLFPTALETEISSFLANETKTFPLVYKLGVSMSFFGEQVCHASAGLKEMVGEFTENLMKSRQR